jgi:hypothetical protein
VAVLGVLVSTAWVASADDDKVIRLRERTTDFAFVENAPPGLLGDYLVFHADLFWRGEKVGTDGGVCHFTSAAGVSQCLATLSFARGDITTQGLNADPTIPFVTTVAVTGGTKAFRGISGDMRINQLSEEEAILTLRPSRSVPLRG